MTVPDLPIESVAGLVVAGGRSTRFGDREKALAEFDGQPMLHRVVETLGTVTDSVVVNCRRDQRPAFAEALADVDTDIRFALDETPDEGPLAGLSTALGTVETKLVVVLGCDMPLVDSDGLAALLARADSGEADAVVPQTPNGPEPLHAVYRVDPTRTATVAVLDDGRRSLRALLDRLAVERVGPDDGVVQAQSLTSVDTEAKHRTLDDTVSQVDDTPSDN